MPKKTNKRLLLVLCSLAALTVIGIVVIVLLNKDNTSAPEASEDAIVITDIETRPIQQVQQDFADNPEAQYQLLMAEAEKKKFVENYDGALPYYFAAAEVTGITQNQIDDANISIYSIAKYDINDQQLAAEYEALLGEKVLFEPVDQNVPSE